MFRRRFRKRFSRAVTWRKKSWVGSSVVDGDLMEETDPGLYLSAVLFVPLVQVVDYATYPFEELAGPVVPQGSRQERVTLTRCKLDAEYVIDTSNSATELWTANVAWYLCKFSLSEVVNAIGNTAGGGMFPYDPLSNTGEFLFKHPVVRHGQDFWRQQYPGAIAGPETFSGFGQQTRKIQFNGKLRLGLETDEEFYLVITASAQSAVELQTPLLALSLQARTQFVT